MPARTIKTAALLLGASLFAAPAFAQTASGQFGTYRPGPAHATSPASAPDQCVSQCSGDAACRAWNFVVVAPERGVCEFLSEDTAPVASNVSVSGTAATASPASSRIVRESSGTTTRIGTPAPRATARQTSARRVVRQPEPVRRSVAPAPRMQPQIQPKTRPQASPQVRPQVRPQRMFRHSVEGAPHMAPAPRITPVPAPPLPRPATKPPVAPVTPAVAVAPRATSPFAPHPAASGRAPIMPPAPPPARVATDMGNTLAVPATRDEALFGHLFDDVAVPAAADPVTLRDPGAPVATSGRAPVAGLAGG